MKKTFLLTTLLLAAFAAGAQNVFFPTKKGVVLTYAETGNDGSTSYTRKTVTDVAGSKDDMVVSYLNETMDGSKSVTQKNECKASVKNGVVVMDVNEIIMSMPEIAVTIGNYVPMEIPANLKVGDVIKNYEVSVNSIAQGMEFPMSSKFTGGKCTGEEELEVKAGKFNCMKVTQTATISVMGQTFAADFVGWYAPGIGKVKTLMYYEDMPVMASELISVE